MLPKPKSYKDIVYPRPEVAKLVDDLVANAQPFPATGTTGLLIWGPYGTGKSTLAQLLPNALEQSRGGQVPVVPRHEKIVSGNNGSALIASLERIAETMPPIGYRHQYIILDELDNLGTAAMKSLKNVMEYGGLNAIFIMTTNHLDQINDAVSSRSHLIEMTAPPASEWLPVVKQALTNAGITKVLSDALLLRLIDGCGGDVRELDRQLERLKRELMLTAPSSPTPSNSPTNAAVANSGPAKP